MPAWPPTETSGAGSAGGGPPVTPLAITLPRFRRLSWASRAARDTWAPRLAGLGDRWLDLVLEIVREGITSALPIMAGPDFSHRLRAAASRRGVSVVPLDPASRLPLLPWRPPAGPAPPSMHKLFVVGRPPAVTGPLNAERLEIPACCARAAGTGPTGWSDPWWPLAVRTATQQGQPPADHEVTLPASSSRLLVRVAMQLPAPWYVPCTLTCPEAARHADAIAALVDEEWSREIDTWPTLWSGLHGIAELKTPLFKLMQPTDATAERLVVRLPGDGAVAGAARGTRFPYVARTRRQRTNA